jgi:hypothetical protein
MSLWLSSLTVAHLQLKLEQVSNLYIPKFQVHENPHSSSQAVSHTQMISVINGQYKKKKKHLKNLHSVDADYSH